MGIRFRCPQGHQLNVKAELAGKRGVCPQCGAKVQIPLPPTQPPSNGGGGSSSTIEVAKAQVGAGETQQHATPFASSSPADGGGETVSVAKTQAEVPSVSQPQAETAKPQAEVVETQAAVEDSWYVRPPGGGQFGPASSNDFAQWLREGRVVAEAYVWRAGWPDWRKAGEVAELPAAIPAVAASAAVPSVAPVAEPAAPAIVVPEKNVAVPRPTVRRQRSANRQLTVAALLLIVAVVLAGVLFWVLNREPPETSQAAGCLPSYNVIG